MTQPQRGRVSAYSCRNCCDRGVKIRQDEGIVSDPAIAHNALAVNHKTERFATPWWPRQTSYCTPYAGDTVRFQSDSRGNPTPRCRERLLRKDAGDRDRNHLPAGSLHLRFCPATGQLLRSDRAKVKDIKMQQHRAMRKALRQC